MADTIEFQLYSPTLGTLDLTADYGSYRYALYSAQFGAATPATTAVNAIVGQSLTFSGYGVRDDVSFYLGVQPAAAGDGASAADGVAAVERWHRATDAEFRFKPRGGAWSCWPIITDPVRRRGGLTVKAVEAPAGGVDAATDEWNNSWRWVQVTLNTHPFALAEGLVTQTVPLSASVGLVEVTGAGDAAATVTLSGGALDKCLVYLAPNMPTGFSPLCRSHMAAGGASLSRAGAPAFYSTTWRAISGATFTLDGSKLPAGGYAIVGHLFNNGTAQSTGLAATVTANGVTRSIVSAPVDLPASGTFFGGVGGFLLPATDGTVTLTFAAASNVYVDELFIVPTAPDSTLWMFDAGSTTNASLSAPATANDTGTMSPAAAIERTAWPVLTAETMTVVAASAGVAQPRCTLSYRPASPTFAPGEDPS